MPSGGRPRHRNRRRRPEAKVGDYVLVHVGFAINIIDEAEAEKVFEYLREMGELGEISNE